MRKTFKKQPGLKQARTTLKYAQELYNYFIAKTTEEKPLSAMRYMFEYETRFNSVLDSVNHIKIMDEIKKYNEMKREYGMIGGALWKRSE